MEVCKLEVIPVRLTLHMCRFANATKLDFLITSSFSVIVRKRGQDDWLSRVVDPGHAHAAVRFKIGEAKSLTINPPVVSRGAADSHLDPFLIRVTIPHSISPKETNTSERLGYNLLF